MKILIIAPYPFDCAASQRFRFEQYLSAMEKRGFSFVMSSFFDKKTWDIIYKPGHFLPKIFGLLLGYLRRFYDVLRVFQFDFVLIHREDSPFGLPIFTWLFAKVFRKKIIYDFDDAIWIPNASDSNDFVSFLKRYANTATICRWAYKISCGNDYLCTYASQFNANVFFIPTVLDTDHYHNLTKNYTHEKLIIGWTGSHSTIKFLDEIFTVLQKLEQEGYPFEFRVISDQAPTFKLKSMKFVPWNKKNEITDLLAFDIGIMPLSDDEWARGKCGFKALQYMSLGIPAMVSPVGVNTQIVDDGINGIICSNKEDWYHSFIKIMQDRSILERLGSASRDKIIRKYSVQAHTENFFGLFS